VLRELLPGSLRKRGLPSPPFRLEDISLITRRALENPFDNLTRYAKRFSPEKVGRTYEEEIRRLTR